MPVTSLTSINININCVDNMSIVFLTYPKHCSQEAKNLHTHRGDIY